MNYGIVISLSLSVILGSSVLGAVPPGVDISTWPADMLVIDAIGNHELLPDPAAQAELARRPNVAEEIVSLVERGASSPVASPYLRSCIWALTQHTPTTPEQRERVFTLAKKAWELERELQGEDKLPEGYRTIFWQAPLVFFTWHHPGAENMLLDMMRRPEVRYSMDVVAIRAARFPTPERLSALKERMAGMKKLNPHYAPDHPSLAGLAAAISIAEKKLSDTGTVNAGAPEFPRTDRTSIEPSGNRLIQSDTGSQGFWQEPFVAVGLTLMAAACGVVLWKRIRLRRVDGR